MLRITKMNDEPDKSNEQTKLSDSNEIKVDDFENDLNNVKRKRFLCKAKIICNRECLDIINSLDKDEKKIDNNKT